MSSKQYTAALVAILTSIAFTVVFIFIGPIQQDESYHHFADTINIIHIHNFWNVVSNIGFVLTGLYGFVVIKKHQINTAINYVLFAGIILTGIGSAYYHFAPNNTTLVWDRLPMTIVFTTFFAQLYSWYICHKTGKIIWASSLVLGIVSVFYWQYTESIHQGDLRLYALVQYLPMLLLLVILAFHYKAFSFLLQPFSMVMLFYIIAKLFEHFDKIIFENTQLIGGHPFKHIAASIASLYIVKMIELYQKNKPVALVA
jgi:hypothetical protein